MGKRPYQAAFKRAMAALPEELSPPEDPRQWRVPTQASSDFLQNQAQGRWAESLVKDLFAPHLTVIPYGNDEDLIAGEEGFAEYYTSYQGELEEIGKRCDLLLFPRTSSASSDDVRRASAGLEVRSSAQMVRPYYATREESKGRRNFLSFTIKVEDLALIHRWVRLYGVRHYFLQVFGDTIYAIDTLHALTILADPEQRNQTFTIEKNSRNQFKTTVHIAIEHGLRLAEVTEQPWFIVRERILSRGRIIRYAEPHGGHAQLHHEAAARIFSAPSLSKGLIKPSQHCMPRARSRVAV